MPALLPASAALFAYTTIPSFRGAYNVLSKELRLGVDVLDAIVVLGCLASLQVFPGAILAWCLSFGRHLVRQTEDNSKKLLLGAFGKQPRYVWLVKDDIETQVSLDRLEKGDVVVVHTGEVVPVDGSAGWSAPMVSARCRSLALRPQPSSGFITRSRARSVGKAGN
jgi:Cu2+-exporting ATPase